MGLVFFIGTILATISIEALSTPGKTMTSANAEAAAAHSEATLALAKKESAEHMQGMTEVYEKMRNRQLIIRAYALDDPNAPSSDNVKVVHFVRHGQGFHNLIADMASAEGQTWVPVRTV